MLVFAVAASPIEERVTAVEARLAHLERENAALKLQLLGVTRSATIQETKMQAAVPTKPAKIAALHTPALARKKIAKGTPLKDWPPLPNRNAIHPILEELGFTTGIEVGVQRGRNALVTLRNWHSCTSYKLVDMWASTTEVYNDTANVGARAQLTNYRHAQSQLQHWTKRNVTEFYRMKSVDAAPKFKDGAFDYVYIDARHDYCGVMEDLRAYWPKVRPGGIFAGHDFVDAAWVSSQKWGANQDWSICADGSKEPRAVKGAVEDFAKEQGLAITVTGSAAVLNSSESWLIQKPTRLRF